MWLPSEEVTFDQYVILKLAIYTDKNTDDTILIIKLI
jgi:hypothetical protein